MATKKLELYRVHIPHALGIHAAYIYMVVLWLVCTLQCVHVGLMISTQQLVCMSRRIRFKNGCAFGSPRSQIFNALHMTLLIRSPPFIMQNRQITSPLHSAMLQKFSVLFLILTLALVCTALYCYSNRNCRDQDSNGFCIQTCPTSPEYVCWYALIVLVPPNHTYYFPLSWATCLNVSRPEQCRTSLCQLSGKVPNVEYCRCRGKDLCNVIPGVVGNGVVGSGVVGNGVVGAWRWSVWREYS